MKRFRTFMLVASLLQVIVSEGTALVGLFAEGGDVWSRTLTVVVHPIRAVGLLLTVVLPRSGSLAVVVLLGLL